MTSQSVEFTTVTRAVNHAIQSGSFLPRSMAKVTLYAEQRPQSRPILRNHWAAYKTGAEQVTEIAVHVDGITIKVWERSLAGTAFVRECFGLGLDAGLLWARFQTDVEAGRAQLSDDSATFQRFLSKNIKHRDPKTGKMHESKIARRDGVSLMVRWLNRQTRFIHRQQDIIMGELNELAGSVNGAWDSLADAPDDNDALLAKHVAEGKATQLQASIRILARRGSAMPMGKVDEVLDRAPASLGVKQARMVKLEGNYTAGVGGQGQLDRYRSAPRRSPKVSAVKVLDAMLSRQMSRAQDALDAGDLALAQSLLKTVEKTEQKLAAAQAAQDAAKQAQAASDASDK